jgi:hypothetical protein
MEVDPVQKSENGSSKAGKMRQDETVTHRNHPDRYGLAAP